MTFKETTKALTPNTAYHPNDHTFAEMSFQLYSFVSWIFTILTILTNGIRSLVTALPKCNSLPDPYTLPVHRRSISDRNRDSITSFSRLCISDHSMPRHGHIGKHLRSQIPVRAKDILFHKLYLFENNDLHTVLDNYAFDCRTHFVKHKNCPRTDFIDLDMDFILPLLTYFCLDSKELYILYVWRYFNGRYYHLVRDSTGMLKTIVTFTDPSLPSSPTPSYHSFSK